MSASGISEPLKQFIFEHLDSIEQLDTLLFLRTHQSANYTATEISNELRANPESIGVRLRGLVSIGLVEVVETGELPDGKRIAHRYHPKDEQLGALVDQLAEVYKLRRHRIFEMMFSPLKRARSFSNAFKVGGQGVRKDEDG